ncbi:MAG: hypothetical protein AUJ23_03690 [Candidatus Magasanikbacteria bacterium CG1_02_32_51]|uniref:DUF5671 domain-containing protein n=1 Tax=Candidatus Magasanikbacteria bacterium CG1_02_32_51 TaxID=1805238 RepID=A0A1J4U878_9BACT|nr:MAG: hypothetical protein AUJ23_03690 [Candidatus Magasanikbacteria bacterium CG1_02_32_51]
MDQTTRNTPKDVFLHLFNIFTFYINIIAFITLLIQYIDKLFPDALNYYFDNISNSVTWASSVLLVSIPAFIITSWLLEKDIRIMPEKKDFRLRKWLLYFTLFLSAITIVVDLMVFVFKFLQGEITIRFFLKIFVVLLVAGAVFAYYMWDLKRKSTKTNVLKFLAIILSVVVLGSVIAGFFIVGTPKEQRNRRLDAQRIQDLGMIQSQIISYWQQKEKLPENLAILQNDISGYISPVDPETKQSYDYRIKSDLIFELCANFTTILNQNESKNLGMYNNYPSVYAPQNWAHAKGLTCFERTIDPELYKTNNNIKPEVVK